MSKLSFHTYVNQTKKSKFKLLIDLASIQNYLGTLLEIELPMYNVKNESKVDIK